MRTYYAYVNQKCDRKNGEMPIYVRYNYNRHNRTLIPTGYSINPEFWNEEKKIVKRSCSLHEEINKKIDEIKTKIGNILNYSISIDTEPTVNFVLVELSKDREYEIKSKKLDLFEQLDKYIAEQVSQVSNDTISAYSALKKHLIGFKEYSSQPITFSNLNIYFYNEFVDYLTVTVIKKDETVGLKNNSVGKHIKNIKAFVNDRVRKKVIPSVDMSAFKRIQEEVDHVYLSEKEIAKVATLDLSSNKSLEEIRDLFIVGCYTGLRFSDLSQLSPQHIDFENEVIKLNQRKVHRAVIIPLIDYVPDILKKYNYKMPTINLNDFNKEIKKIVKMANITQKQEITTHIGKKTVKEIKNKNEFVSSHTCRRSFCTNMYLAGFPAEELMKISGHKSPAAFLTYIKIDNLNVALRLKKLRMAMVIN